MGAGIHLVPLNELNESAISHLNIQDIGVNSHADLDVFVTAVIASQVVTSLHIADGTIHYVDAPADGEPYVRQDNAWVLESKSGGLWSTQYRFSTSTTEADPGSGRFRYDDAVHANVGEIYLDDENNSGTDLSNFLALLAIGDRIYVQDEGDASESQVWNVVGPAPLDNGGWWTISVTLERDGGTLSNNARCIFAVQIQGSTDLIYLRLDATNSPLTGELTVQNVMPVTPQQRDLGDKVERYKFIAGRLGIFVGESNSSGGINAPGGQLITHSGNSTGLIAGNMVKGDTGVTEMQLSGGAYKSVAVMGNVNSYSTGAARLINIGGGAFVGGSAFAYGTGDAEVFGTGPGGFTWAYAYTGYGGTAKDHNLTNSASGGFLQGYSYGYGTVDVTVSGQGAFAQGFFSASLATSYTVFRSTGRGSFAQGAVVNNAAVTSTLEATGQGAFAQGQIQNEGRITSSGLGSFAQGRANNGGAIEATQDGAFAHGFANVNDIRAIADGAFAIGDATNGDCTASGINSCQFGPGTNTLADTFQIGNGGIRFKGTTGAPSALQNGDIWVNAGYMYFRTNGVSVKMVACP